MLRSIAQGLTGTDLSERPEKRTMDMPFGTYVARTGGREMHTRFRRGNLMDNLEGLVLYGMIKMVSYCKQTDRQTPWIRVFLGTLTLAEIVKKLFAFYGMRMFVTAFTTSVHSSLS